jgi:hypothetical protein
MLRALRWCFVASSLCASIGSSTLPDRASAAELSIRLPLARTAYQTNEWIDISVVRQAAEPLPAGDLTLTLAGADGSRAEFAFSVPAVAAQEGGARATEHLHVNGWLLRPGPYAVEVACDGATATSEIEVFSHLRKSSFRTISWGRAAGPAQLAEGEDSLGFNLFYGGYGADDEANFIRAGVDFMANCVMSGGHQMDLRMECDWSDPLVTRGGTRRVVRRAFIDRTRPNVPGVHFYDEPGLTWHKHPVTGEFGPHGVPAQVRAFRSAFGRDPLSYHEVDPNNPEHMAQWRHWALWKLGFMDAAWQEAQFGVSQVRDDYLSVTQSQYGWTAFSDGYYFNVARSLPITSGHGGYHDYGLGYFNPSFFLEMARARDWEKPCWYLSTWYGNTTSAEFRLEQYLSLMTGVQGLMSPPDIDPFDPASKPAADGVLESNKLCQRLGTIFTTMPVTRPPVAMLYSLSQAIHEQTLDRHRNYAHDSLQGQRLPLVYLAGKILKQPFMTVVDEDIVDGTLAAHHKAVVLTSIAHLDPPVLRGLEDFVRGGGLVLLTGDCTVEIAGAVKLSVTPDLPDAEIVRALYAEGKWQDTAPYTTVGKFFAGAQPLADALRVELEQAGIQPVLGCDQAGIVASRQAQGDVEYLFAVNATYDEEVGGRNAVRATEATLTLPDDGRPVYDAVLGRPAEFRSTGQALEGYYRFGAGQMRVFARTARHIERVQVLAPAVERDYTRAGEPLRVQFAAAVLDSHGGVLAGSVPMAIEVYDALGARRYELFRATEQGVLRLAVPLAANDPPGQWRIVARELLSHRSAEGLFELTAPLQVAALAGATERAVSFGNDRQNVFRFFRTHQTVTIVLGTASYHRGAAERLAESVRPWGVECRIVDAAEVNRPREISAEEAATWVGLEYAGSGQMKPGRENSVLQVGFDVRGPVVLIGSPEDNPLVAFVQAQRFLPYQPEAGIFPGRGRGYIAWQRDAIGPGQESIALIAHDEAGMAEAVGTLYEYLAGLEPLTRYALPLSSAITPAASAVEVLGLPVQWELRLPDRAAALKTEADGLHVVTLDGSRVTVDQQGAVREQRTLAQGAISAEAEALRVATDPAALAVANQAAPRGRIVKFAAAGQGRTAAGYWGGLVQIVDPAGQVVAAQQLDQDLTGLAWLGDWLVVGLADGRIVALKSP